MKRFSILLAALLMGTGSLLAQSHQWFIRHILSDKHAMMSVNTQKRYILLPIEEKENETTIKVIKDSHSMQDIKVRLATGKPDYFVPLDISKFGKDGKVLLDFSFQGNYRTVGNIEDYSCWQLMKESDTFDTTNREAYRPVYHHTPLWGWMNDPNGLFYKDGVWNLYYQYNLYGSTWENMTWGHATSRDS